MFRMTRLASAIAAASLTAIPAYAQTNNELEPVIVTATRTAFVDSDAPYASEVYTAEDIKKSGASTIYDFLNRNTSIIATPSFGNAYAQLLDMRGYGIENGFGAIVISINGRRLNHIDNSPQLLSSIPLKSINRIEITKGSGGVRFGDGAMAGTIQIYTHSYDGAEATMSTGNHGTKNIKLSAGASNDVINANLNGEFSEADGFSQVDSTGHTDHSQNKNLDGTLQIQVTENALISFGIGKTDLDNRYPYPLTIAEFNSDPSQYKGKTGNATAPYNHQELDEDRVSVRLEYDINNELKLDTSASSLKKDSIFSGVNPEDYHHEYSDAKIEITNKTDVTERILGFELLDRSRHDANANGWGLENTTKKNNRATYFTINHRATETTTVSAGARHEKVKYTYTPISGSGDSSKFSLTSLSGGVNHKIHPNYNIFIDIEQANQSPDIQKSFSPVYDNNYNVVGSIYNASIKPAKAKTINVGLNATLDAARVKATVFYSDLENEIYTDSNYENTNIDESHKTGLDLQVALDTHSNVNTLINYSYVRAVIDEEAGQNINGHDIPGVPRHSLSIGMDFKPSGNQLLHLSHTWRSSSEQLNVFLGGTEKQMAYSSTDAKYSYQNKNLEFFAGVQNIFEKHNGLNAYSSVYSVEKIYPLDFTRNWQIGLNAKF
jgi:iron complex outermembrane receptor protein